MPNMFKIGRVAMTRVDKRWIFLSNIVREARLDIRAKSSSGQTVQITINTQSFSSKSVDIEDLTQVLMFY